MRFRFVTSAAFVTMNQINKQHQQSKNSGSSHILITTAAAATAYNNNSSDDNNKVRRRRKSNNNNDKNNEKDLSSQNKDYSPSDQEEEEEPQQEEEKEIVAIDTKISASSSKRTKHSTDKVSSTASSSSSGATNVNNDTTVYNINKKTKFHITTCDEARCLTDGVVLSTPPRRITTSSNDDNNNNIDDDVVIMPWLSYGTYKLGEKNSYEGTLNAIKVGYRCIDTAFIYGGEKTEIEVGRAINDAIKLNIISSRKDIFLITKQWRNYHGYEQTKECFMKSLHRLQTPYVDLYLIHWPGPPYNTMHRKKDIMETEGPWYYSKIPKDKMSYIRSETWRSMEDLYKDGYVRSIGVSNFTIKHLQTLKQTASKYYWPPSINQVECHPLYKQNKLRTYCNNENIIIQSYASLGGQDGTKVKWNELFPNEKEGGTKKHPKTLLTCNTIQHIANEINNNNDNDNGNVINNNNKEEEEEKVIQVTPAQILLKWCIQRNCTNVVKTNNIERMIENSKMFNIQKLSTKHMNMINNLLVDKKKNKNKKKKGEDIINLKQNNDDDEEEEENYVDDIDESAGRLCWRTDPLRMLDFD